MPMRKIQLLAALAAAALLCGCDKQVKLNTEKIDVLTQKMFVVQQNQSKQLADIQTQLTSLTMRMDKTEAEYFLQSQDKALFYHTNALYFLLTIDKKIQSQFQLAESARDSASTRAFFYHTNTLDTLYFCTSQLADAMTAQEKRIEDSIKDETARLAKTLGDELANQKNSAAANKADTLKQMEAMQTKLGQIQRDLDQLKAQMAKLGQPSAQQ